MRAVAAVVVLFVVLPAPSVAQDGLLSQAERLAQGLQPGRQQVRSGPSVGKTALVLGMVIGGAAMTLVEPTQPTQPGRVNLSAYLGDGDYPGHTYRLFRSRGDDYGFIHWHGCGSSRRCIVTTSSLERRLLENYRFGYTDGHDDGLFEGRVQGHREGWTQGWTDGQRSMIEIIDANGFVVYEGPFIPYEERSPAMKYGGVALAAAGALIAVLWQDGPRLSAAPTVGGASGSVSFGF